MAVHYKAWDTDDIIGECLINRAQMVKITINLVAKYKICKVTLCDWSFVLPRGNLVRLSSRAIISFARLRLEKPYL